jgi:hypothetical protein
MQLRVYDVLYSHCSHHHVSAAITAIFRVMLLLQEYKDTNVVSFVIITPEQLKLHNYNYVILTEIIILILIE